MPEIKLVAVDMDGTLLNNKKEKPKTFIPWVKSHPKIRVVIASGRQYETLRRDFEEIEDKLYFMADNGALVFYRNEMLYCNEMKRETIIKILDFLETMPNVHVILCGAKSAYMKKPTPAGQYNADLYYKKLKIVSDLKSCIDNDIIVKLALYFEENNAKEEIEKFAGVAEGVDILLSGREWIDILNTGVNKGGAIKSVQEKYDILPDESMAFGDYMNDYEMIKACTESYAMENALDAVKEAAKYVTASNEDDGVMKVLCSL